MTKLIRTGSLPALGDLRYLGAGDTIVIEAAARGLSEWPRYSSAIADAVGRGAEVVQR